MCSPIASSIISALRDHFERVFGSELDGTRVDKSHLLEYALKEIRSIRAKPLMIGDRSHDMVGAKNNGMTGIGVMYGYGSRDELLRGRRAAMFAPRRRAILELHSRDTSGNFCRRLKFAQRVNPS